VTKVTKIPNFRADHHHHHHAYVPPPHINKVTYFMESPWKPRKAWWGKCEKLDELRLLGWASIAKYSSPSHYDALILSCASPENKPF
jgi:hypothetical protein